MTVFVLLAMMPAEPRKLLNEMLPNDTRAWKTWKDTVLDKIEKNQELRFSENHWNIAGFRDDETSLLKTLYGDAEDAYEGHLGHRASRSDDIEKGV
ncbi:hypothetical protein SERLA73DRAFT_177825 [Serpula lacrymans var. lacrymans S7.3]|uniref:Uncharacterized protein n=3 Tax=Serpula lacrymans var. lacrymans TaxID=341189 RepID=F8PPN2_SERL3|nr:hypothetical protein SERLA73DRAFT_177825 [Serpula lacrymans var. lacrymans S7.3]